MGRKGDPRERHIVDDLPRIRELDEEIISKVLLQYRRFFLRSIFIAIFIVHNPRVPSVQKKYAYCFAIRKLLKPKPVISLEIISLATGSRAKEKSHRSLRLARLEDEKLKRREKGKKEEERTSDRLA